MREIRKENGDKREDRNRFSFHSRH